MDFEEATKLASVMEATSRKFKKIEIPKLHARMAVKQLVRSTNITILYL